MPQGLGQQVEILEHHGEDVQILAVIVFADIEIIHDDLSFRGFIEAAEELYEGGFAASVHAYHSQTFSGTQVQIDVAQGKAAAARVPEADVAEGDVKLPVAALFHGQAALVHIVFDVKEGKVVCQEFFVLPNPAGNIQKRLNTFRQSPQITYIFDDASHREGAQCAVIAHDEIGEACCQPEKDRSGNSDKTEDFMLGIHENLSVFLVEFPEKAVYCQLLAVYSIVCSGWKKSPAKSVFLQHMLSDIVPECGGFLAAA